MSAEGAGGRGGGFDLPLIHAVEVTVEIPGRSADDAAGPVVGVRGRVAGAAEQTDVGERQRVVLQQRTFVGGGAQADQVGREAIGVEEIGRQRDLVGEAEAFRSLAAVAVLDEVDRRADRGDRAEVAGGPLGGARRGPQQFRGRTQFVDEVRAVVVEVRGHARIERGVGRAVEERLTAVGDSRGGGGVLLARIHLQRAEDRVRQFEGGREVGLHAAVERVGEDGEGQRGDLVPEQAGGRGHRVAGGEATALAGGPGVEVTAGAGLRELEEVPVAGVQDVVGAPGLVVRAEASRQQGGCGGVEGRRDGLDGAALRGGTSEAFVPIGHGGGGEGRVGVWQVDLRLDAFVTDPVSVAAAGAERAAGHRRTRHRHRREVDRAIKFLEEGRRRRGGPLHAAGHLAAGADGRAADQTHVVRRGDRVLRRQRTCSIEQVDEGLAFAAGAAGDLAGRGVEVGAVGEVEGERVRVGELLVAAGDGERRSQPAEEEARVMRVRDVPVARLGRIDAAGGPDAGPITPLVMDELRRFVRISRRAGRDA